MGAPTKRIQDFLPAPVPLSPDDLILVSHLGLTRNARVGDVVPTGVEFVADKNQPNGYAGLGPDGKLSASVVPQVLVGAVQYQGVWDANANNPPLASSVGTKGFYYKVSIAGSTNLDGNSTWQVNDVLIFNGSTWDHLSGTDGIVTINGKGGPTVTLGAADILFQPGTTVAQALASLNNEIADHESRISSLESSRTTDEQRITSLENSSGGTSTDVTNLKNRVTSLENSRTQDEAAFSDFQQKTSQNIGNLNGQVTTLQNGKQDITAKDVAGGYAGLDKNGYLKASDYDPTVVQLKSEKGQANGYAPLDSNGLIPPQNIPQNVATTANNVSVADTDGYGSTNVQGLLDAIGGKLKTVASAQQADETNISNNASAITTLQNTAEYSAHKGAANGYVGLDANKFVPVANLPPTVQLTTLRGQPNGYAPLDANGQVPTTYLPAAVLGAMSFQGTWDASKNNPTLTSSQGTKGFYYKVSVKGGTTLDGHTNWQVGDLAIFDGTTWDRVAGADGEVLSVNGVVPDANGNIAISFGAAAISYADTYSIGATTVQAAIDKVINTAEFKANKGAANGYAGLDGNSWVPLANLNPNLTAKAANVSYTDNYSTGSTTVQGAVDFLAQKGERTANKGVANGYAGLDANGKIPQQNIPSSVATNASSVSYVDNESTGKTNVQDALDYALTHAEMTANKGAANGYAPLDANKKLPVANLPAIPASSVAYTDTYSTGQTTVQGELDYIVGTALPKGLTRYKTEFFTASSAVSSGGGWIKDTAAQWITVIVVGGGAGGSSGPSASYGGIGGEPGGVEIYSGPASDFPASADITIGAGGGSVYGQNQGYDGANSQFGTMLRAMGGRSQRSSGWPGQASGQNYPGAYDYPRSTLRLGRPSYPGINNAAPASEPSMMGPGPGGPSGNTNYSINGSAGGQGSYGRPASSTTGGAAATGAGSNGAAGANAVANDPWSYGAGGGGAAPQSSSGGNGGIPGGGGGGLSNTGNASYVSGIGGRGEIRVLSYKRAS